MKILKIREGKIKVSLSPEEAVNVGLLRGQAISNKDLCTVVRHLLKEHRECEGWEKILVEAYPKMDGSYDIFVMGERQMATEKREDRQRRGYYGFGTREHLAFALYVLSGNRKTSPCLLHEEGGAPPLPRENVLVKPTLEERERPLPVEVYEFFGSAELKNENPEHGAIQGRLPPHTLYRTEHLTGEKECFSYILEVETEEGSGGDGVSFLCEFGRELSSVTEELLTEHTQKICPEELFS